MNKLLEQLVDHIKHSNPRLLAWGEVHQTKVNAHRRVISDFLLDHASDLGFTHLLLEFKSSHQPALDQWLSDEQSLAALNESFIGTYLSVLPDFLWEAIKDAHQKGTAVLAIGTDERPDVPIDYSIRDVRMASRAGELLKDENNRLMFYGGMAHTIRRKKFSGRETYRSFVELLVQNSLDEHLVFSIGELGARQITPNARKTLSAQCNQFWLDLKGSEWQHQIIIQRTLSDNHETPGISRQRLVVFADEYDALFLDFSAAA